MLTNPPPPVRSRDELAEYIRTSLSTHLTMVLLKVYPQRQSSKGKARRVVTSTRFGSRAMMKIAQMAGAPPLSMVGRLRAARANLG